MLSRRKETSSDTAVCRRSIAEKLALNSSYYDPLTKTHVRYVVGNVPVGFCLMYGAGLVSALLGIGSGVLKIPPMDTALRLPIKVSSATSTFMIGATAAASAVVWFVQGNIDISIAAPVTLGSVAGAMRGARLLTKIPVNKLRIFFVLVLLILSVQMLLSAFNVQFMGYAI